MRFGLLYEAQRLAEKSRVRQPLVRGASFPDRVLASCRPTIRSNAYEQLGQGIDPRDTRAMWEESITMLPRIWQSDEFSWEGKFWKVPSRRVLPKPVQTPHPRMYLACTQIDGYDVAAQNGIGVLSSATFATTILAGHVKRYRARVQQATPVGAVVNEYWGNNVHAFCGEDNDETRNLAALSLKTFFGPDKPYIRDRDNACDQLLESWGGVPDHLRADFGRWLRQSDEAHKAQAAQVGISLDSGPGSARGGVRSDGSRHAVEAGVDQVILIMQTETIPHERALQSIEMFGKHVIPARRTEVSARPVPAAV